MIKRKSPYIICFRNTKSQFGALACFTSSLAAALKRCGARVEVFDLVRTPRLLQALPRADATLGFNILVTAHDIDSISKTPHVALLVDSVVHHQECLTAPYMRAAFVEQDSCSFYQQVRHQPALYLPHAVDERLLARDGGKRPYDLVMVGSFVDADAIYRQWKEQLPPERLKAACDVVEEALADGTKSWLQLVCERQLFELAGSIEVYLRGVDRQRLLQTFAPRGVHVWCSEADRVCWERVLHGDDVQFHDAVPFNRLPAILRKSKVVLHSAPMIRHGLHERFLMALACGASVLSSDSVCLREWWPPSKAVQYYVSGTDMQSAVDRMLGDEPARLDDVMVAREVLRDHTWDVRARQLMNALASAQWR